MVTVEKVTFKNWSETTTIKFAATTCSKISLWLPLTCLNMFTFLPSSFFQQWKENSLSFIILCIYWRYPAVFWFNDDISACMHLLSVPAWSHSRCDSRAVWNALGHRISTIMKNWKKGSEISWVMASRSSSVWKISFLNHILKTTTTTEKKRNWLEDHSLNRTRKCKWSMSYS